MTADASPLAAALADRYRLEGELGQGGMATVYLAHDLRHDRPVALKVLHPELAATLGPERFLREIRTAARLQHPHILGVHDSGEAAGRLWFTMPYVEGESLRDRLRRERQLPVDEAVRITREAAQALDYAHRQAVIHRDVKPENLLLLAADGSTLVADFGVAFGGSDTPPGGPSDGGQSRLTGTGLAIGTPAYMSPEQATGARDLDARTDVYALGTVLYEMLVGEPPFAGPTPQAAIARRFTEAPRPIRQLRETVPDAVEQAVLKALARAPADRFSSAAEFARALVAPATPASAPTTPIAAPAPAAPPLTSAGAPGTRRRVPVAALALVVGLLLGLGVLFAWRRGRHPAEAEGGSRRLAVLPFENLGDSADAYFADGVADEVRGKLAALPGVEVIARASSAQYRGTPKPPGEIARELGVHYLLTGTVRWEKSSGSPGRVRVSPELVDATNGTTRWQQPFDAPLTDVFQVQGDIAARVAEALGVALGAGQRERLAARPTQNLDAYARYLRGRELTAGENTPEALRAATTEYRAAVELDPAFAAAWAALAIAYVDIFRFGGMQVADTRLAHEAVQRSADLAADAPATRLAAARYANFIDGDLETSLRQLRAGLELAPAQAELLAAAGEVEVQLGRPDEGIADLEHAARLDPRSPQVLGRLAANYYGLGRVSDAEAAITRARALRPSSMGLAYQHATILAGKGDLAGVRRVLATMEPVLGARPVAAYVALRENLIALLDSIRLRQMLVLTPADLDNGRADWALAMAEGHWLLGDSAAARAYGDTASAAYVEQRRSLEGRLTANDRAMIVGLQALALGYAGQATEARAAARRAVAEPRADDYIHHLAARAYLVSGEPKAALDELDGIANGRFHGSATRAWLRIDPSFAPLRGNPRFDQLVGEP